MIDAALRVLGLSDAGDDRAVSLAVLAAFVAALGFLGQRAWALVERLIGERRDQHRAFRDFYAYVAVAERTLRDASLAGGADGRGLDEEYHALIDRYDGPGGRFRVFTIDTADHAALDDMRRIAHRFTFMQMKLINRFIHLERQIHHAYGRFGEADFAALAPSRKKQAFSYYLRLRREHFRNAIALRKALDRHPWRADSWTLRRLRWALGPICDPIRAYRLRRLRDTRTVRRVLRREARSRRGMDGDGI